VITVIYNIPLYYDKINNIFIDTDGIILFDIFTAITPNDLYLFKKNKTNIKIQHKKYDNITYELKWTYDILPTIDVDNTMYEKKE
jgi:hypothetical protein